MTTAKYMKMQVQNGLPSVSPCIGHNSITRFGKALVCGNLPTSQEQAAKQRLIFLAEILNGCDMPLWNDQGVNGCLRADIIER